MERDLHPCAGSARLRLNNLATTRTAGRAIDLLAEPEIRMPITIFNSVCRTLEPTP